MLSWRNESLRPSAAAVISVKIGARARLTTCSAAVQRTTCQPDACLRQRHLPHAHVFDPVRLRARADDVVADGGARESRTSASGSVDRGDEELRDGDLAQIAGQPLQFRGEGARVERGVARQIPRSLHVEGPRARGRFIGGRQPCAAEAGTEERADQGGRLRRARAQGARQLAQPRVDLLSVPLQGERVVSRFEMLQERLARVRNRQLRPVDDAPAPPSIAPVRPALTLGGRSGRGAEISAASRPAIRTLSSRRPGLLRGPSDVGQRQDVEAIGRQLLPLPAATARHSNLHVDRTGVVSESEVRAQIVLREEAATRTDLAYLSDAGAADRDPRADREAVPGAATQRLPPPSDASSPAGSRAASATSSVLLTTRSRSPSLSRSPTARPRPDARDLQPGAGAFRDVTEPCAGVQQQLVFLAIRLAELRKVFDVGKDVAVGEEQIELPVEVGVEEGRAPSHAGERGPGDPGRGADVLEVPAVEIVEERIAVVGEGREDEIHPPVAVVVAGVGAHSGLRACVSRSARRRRQGPRSRSGRSPGCGRGSSGSSRWPRTDRRSRRCRSRSPRRRNRTRARHPPARAHRRPRRTCRCRRSRRTDRTRREARRGRP